jgi:hypothetical protein
VAFQNGFAEIRKEMMAPQDVRRLISRVEDLETVIADLPQQSDRRTKKEKQDHKQPTKPR